MNGKQWIPPKAIEFDALFRKYVQTAAQNTGAAPLWPLVHDTIPHAPTPRTIRARTSEGVDAQKRPGVGLNKPLRTETR